MDGNVRRVRQQKRHRRSGFQRLQSGSGAAPAGEPAGDEGRAGVSVSRAGQRQAPPRGRHVLPRAREGRRRGRRGGRLRDERSDGTSRDFLRRERRQGKQRVRGCERRRVHALAEAQGWTGPHRRRRAGDERGDAIRSGPRRAPETCVRRGDGENRETRRRRPSAARMPSSTSPRAWPR